MKKQISIAKITPPRLSGVFLRKRLFKLLDKSRNCPVIWITAPPGAGKTTLVSTYLEHKKLPCLWYQIDEGDGDIASFFHYMGIAAKLAAPRYRKSLPNLTPEYLLGLPTFTRNYFRELYSRINPIETVKRRRGEGGQRRIGETGKRRSGEAPFQVVLDNYQDVPADSPLHEIIQIGLSEIPDGINVIIISRIQPPAQMTRLQASNNLTMLQWDDLRLTEEESIGIARLRGGKKRLSQKTLQAIHEQTQGWAAGLALMLEKAAKSKLEELKHPTIDTIFDYFASEILDKADKETRSLLLKTSVLNSMDAGMAHQLTGIEMAGQILSKLHTSNCFTERRLHSNPVYQYHPLFREFLRERAATALPEDELRGLKRRAAALLSESGKFEEAYALFRDTCDWDGAIRVVMQRAPALAAEGRLKVLGEWIAAMPTEAVEANPWLLYWKGVCSFPFALEKAREDMEKAYHLFHKLNDHTGVFLSWAGIIDSIFNEGEEFSLLDPWINSLEGILKEGISFPSLEIEFRVTVSMFAALLWRRFGHPDTKIWKERAFSTLSRCEDKNIRIQLLTFLSVYHIYIGDFVFAEKLVNALQDMSELKETASFLALWVKATEAMYEWVTASFDSCLKAVAEGIRIADATGIHIWDPHLIEHGAAAALSTGDLITANNMLNKLKPYSGKLRLVDKAYYEYLKAWEALIRKDLPSYPDYIELRHISETLGLNFGEVLFHQVLAEISHERGDEKRASEHLAKLIKLAGEMDSRYVEFIAYMLEAQISFDRGEDDKGLAALKSGMAIGMRQGFMNFHGWRPDVMAMLCVRALEHGIEVEYVQKLIKARNIIPEKPPLHIENWPWPVRIYTLGRFAIVKDGKPLHFTEKAKHMPLKLLKAIISLGGRDIGAEVVIDTLWPDAEGDAAYRAFVTNLQRLRRLIGHKDAVEHKDGRLTLDPRCVWVDVWTFERLLSQAEAISPFTASQNEAIRLIEKAVSIYHGRFLSNEQPWAASFSERLRAKFLHNIERIGRYWEDIGDWQKAQECYQNAINIDDLSEIFYQRLMMVYQHLGRTSDAIAVYQRCCKVLSSAMGIPPSPATEEIYKNLKQTG